MVSRILGQALLLLISTVLLGVAIIMAHQRWSASRGPLTVAVLQSKTVEIRKRGSKAYIFQLTFKPDHMDSVVVDTEVGKQAYLTYSLRSLVTIHYDDANYQNIVLASESWLQWITIVMFALGVLFIYATFSVKPSRGKRLTKPSLFSY